MVDPVFIDRHIQMYFPVFAGLRDSNGGKYRIFRKVNKTSQTPVLPELVIYHKVRDFGHSLRDKKNLLVTSHEPL